MEIKLVTFMSSSESVVADATKELNELFNGDYFKYESWIDDIVYRITGVIDKDKLEGTNLLDEFVEVEDFNIEDDYSEI